MNNKKVKVSKHQFSEILYFWLSNRLSNQAIEETAKDLDFVINNNEDFNKLFDELFTLNMWLIVRACERVFDDDEKRNDCLDTFHHLVYERYHKGTEENFDDWIALMAKRYIDYVKAMDTEHPAGPAWVLAKVINKNLFREVKKDIWVQTMIGAYIGIYAKNLEELIRKYDIE